MWYWMTTDWPYLKLGCDFSEISFILEWDLSELKLMSKKKTYISNLILGYGSGDLETSMPIAGGEEGGLEPPPPKKFSDLN